MLSSEKEPLDTSIKKRIKKQRKQKLVKSVEKMMTRSKVKNSRKGAKRRGNLPKGRGAERKVNATSSFLDLLITNIHPSMQRKKYSQRVV